MCFFERNNVKKVGIRWAVIVAVFFIALFISNIILNKGTTDMTVEMQEATLPVISVLYNGQNVNYMWGYTSRKDNGTMRDSISPIGDDRTLSFVVNTYNTPVTRVRYEVRSADGSRLIENTNIGNYEQRKGNIYGTVSLKDLIDDEKEYNLCFILTLSDGKEAYYYTRIIRSDVNVEDKIAFVKDFMSKTFEGSTLKELSMYMEPNSEGDNTSFGKVNIHSSLSQLGWGEMYPRKYGDMIITIHEIDKQTASISVEYTVSIRDDNNNGIYRVEEYYRLRQSNDRFYLLSFDRTMNQLFSPEKTSFVNNKIMIGITSGDMQMQESEDGNIIVFVNEGRLFSYDISGNRLATLYAYYSSPDTDLRDTYNKSRVKILNVEENGNVSFAVYGYLNRGMHEGRTGIVAYYYNALLNTIEEQAYIEYDKSPEVLMCDVDRLCYLNSAGNLFVYIDGNIEKFDFNTMKAETVADNISESTLFVSDKNRTAVWQNMDGNSTDDLYILEMSDGFLNKADKTENECAKAIGFMNEDLIYGISKSADLIINPLGDVVFPMDKLMIRDESGVILKEYDFEDIYVTEGRITDNQISLKRVKKDEEGNYTEIHDDQITNNNPPEAVKNKLSVVATEKYEKITQIEMKKDVDNKSIKFQTPKEVLFEGGKEIYIPKHTDKNRFYMYYNGHITAIDDDPGNNIPSAALLRATIVDNNGNEIYKRASTASRNQIMAIKEEDMDSEKTAMNVCLDTVLRNRGISRNTGYMLEGGQTPIDIMKNNLPDVYILDMTGASTEALTYYLNQDIPILAIAEHRKAVLLIGYNEQNLVWYDPSLGSIYKKGIKDSAEIFEEEGNRFLTYIPIEK